MSPSNRLSAVGEAISRIEQDVPTASELQKRERFYRRMEKLRSPKPKGRGLFPTAEQMIREDRER